MTRDEMIELARGNVEANLSDAVSENGDPDEMDETVLADTMYNEAYVLALDKLLDEGIDDITARQIASEVANSFACP